MYKTFEELKEELGDKYDRFMYDMNLELVKQKEKAIEDIEFCLNSINQEKEMSIDGRTRNEMESCTQVLNETLNILNGRSDE